MENCTFCKIACRKIRPEDIFYEDEKLFAMIDQDWAVKGHVLVIWKKHVRNISDLSEKNFLHFSKIVRKTEACLLDYLNVDKSIILKSGGLQSHFHFHIYPVKSDISWEAVKDIFDKKARYTPSDIEAKDLIIHLKKVLWNYDRK